MKGGASTGPAALPVEASELLERLRRLRGRVDELRGRL
jgi:hypothetical protein